MNPNINTSIGNPMIRKSMVTTPAVPAAEPVGRVAGVIFVALVTFVAFANTPDMIGNRVLTDAKKGNTIAASNNPIINAQIASKVANMSAKDTTGNDLTSSPFNPNFKPPILGTNIL